MFWSVEKVAQGGAIHSQSVSPLLISLSKAASNTVEVGPYRTSIGGLIGTPSSIIASVRRPEPAKSSRPHGSGDVAGDAPPDDVQTAEAQGGIDDGGGIGLNREGWSAGLIFVFT